MPKFTGGLVGYFAYDTVREYETRLKNPPDDDLQMPDCHLLLCDEIVAFDHLRHRMLIILNIPADALLEGHYHAAELRAEQLASLIRSFTGNLQKKKHANSPLFSANITKEEYVKAVARAKEYIVDGDIFQVVLSRRIEITNPPDAFDTYRTLRATNPSPYMYYFKMNDIEIAGSSPEMLVSVESGEIFNRPIAGTIRRGRTEAEDIELENELKNDKKEQAEHTMLVDLGRNDVGKVSQFGSVEVTKYMTVEKYSQVMHLVTDVKGKLKDGKDCIDALTAVLPAGTLSGAPKVRAMEIIDELEKSRRGLYGGAVGYIGFDGDMDTCIAIRTVLYKDGRAYVQTGAGIVYDSIPEKEFLETESKAKAMVKAIQEAGDLQ
jgi:anthranilate synthase component 1